MNPRKERNKWNYILAIAIVALIVEIVGFASLIYEETNKPHKTTACATEMTEATYIPSKWSINDYELPTYPWQEEGYSSVMDYHDDLMSMREEAKGSSDQVIELYSQVITDEQSKLLREYEQSMIKAVSIKNYNVYLEKFNVITDECDEKLVKIGTSNPIYNDGNSYDGYSSSGSGLTRSGGVFHFNGRRETWYSQKEYGQTVTARDIPGKSVGSDGVIRDADGYICVAASDLPMGSIIETSLGTGKVYDTGCASGTTDIYTDW